MLIERSKIKNVLENLPDTDKALFKEHLLFILNNMPAKCSLKGVIGYSNTELIGAYNKSIMERQKVVENLSFWGKNRQKFHFNGSGEVESFVEAVYTIKKNIGLKNNIQYSLLDLCEIWSAITPYEFYKEILKYFPEDVDTYIFGKRTILNSVIPLDELENIKILFDFFIQNQGKLNRDLKTIIVDYHKAFSKQFSGFEKLVLWKELILNNVEDGETLSYIWNDKLGVLENEQYLMSDSDIFQFVLDSERFLVSIGGTLKKSFLNTKLQEYVNNFIRIKSGSIGKLNEKYQFEEVKVTYLSVRKKISFLLVLKKGSNKNNIEVNDNLMEMLNIFKVLERDILSKVVVKTKEPKIYIENAINLINTKSLDNELSQVIKNVVSDNSSDIFENEDYQDFKL